MKNRIAIGSLMFVFAAFLFTSVATNSVLGGNSSGGLPQLQDDLDAEAAARADGDASLQEQINTIELTPGPQGPQGDKGDIGETGAKGDKGDQGIQGVAGNDGAKGDQGIQGVAGNDGAKGDSGTDGTNGTDGLAGADGAKGDKGDKGDTGDTGLAGADGVTPWTDDGLGTVSTLDRVAIGSSVQIGDETITCDGTTAGTIRWTGTDFEGCDGISWVSLISDTYAIGETGPAGGIVFYTTDGGLHGMEAGVDQGSVMSWGCYDKELGVYGTNVGSGEHNTQHILSGCTETGTAARIASEYTLNNYDDWYLPSIEELEEIWKHDEMWNFFNGKHYWSSSEISSDEVEITEYGSRGGCCSGYKIAMVITQVIPVRSF